MNYKWINSEYGEDISKLVIKLTEEIMQRTGVSSFDLNPLSTKKLCKELLEQEKYLVIAAFDQEKMVGFGTLCESYALYAQGKFGILQEFYVLPEYRSEHIGHEMLAAIKHYAKQVGWKRIELCTPPVPEFDQTVSFYQANGFDRTGGYKMRCLIQSL